MKCKNCGKELREDLRFCLGCGAPAADAKDEYKVTLCADGKYRWRYDASLYTNLSIYFIVWKIFFWIITVGFAVMALIDLINGDTDLLTGALKMYGVIAGGMTVFTLLCYYIYALYMGGKYCVEFVMDEKGVDHKQIPSQAKKAKKLGAAAAAAGAARGSLSSAGAGVNSMRTSMYSEFSRVKKVKAYKRRNVIKVNQTLSHNQVYARDEDFDFVKDALPRA